MHLHKQHLSPHPRWISQRRRLCQPSLSCVFVVLLSVIGNVGSLSVGMVASLLLRYRNEIRFSASISSSVFFGPSRITDIIFPCRSSSRFMAIPSSRSHMARHKSSPATRKMSRLSVPRTSAAGESSQCVCLLSSRLRAEAS